MQSKTYLGKSICFPLLQTKMHVTKVAFCEKLPIKELFAIIPTKAIKEDFVVIQAIKLFVAVMAKKYGIKLALKVYFILNMFGLHSLGQESISNIAQ